MRWRRYLLAASVVIAVGVVGAVGAYRIGQAAQSLRSAESSIDAVVEALADGRIADAKGGLRTAEDSIERANETLRSSLSLTLISPLPVARQNLDSLRNSVELAATVVHGGERILSTADALEGPDGTLEVSLTDGSVPVEAIETARVEVQALLDQLTDVRADEGSAFLLGPTRDARRAVQEEALRRRAELDRVNRGLAIMQELVGADRPRRYLIAVANTAEMRGTGGMMLNYGVLEGNDGTLELGNFGRVEELVIGSSVDPVDAGLPEDYLRRWDGFAVTEEWRNATMAADLPLVAPALELMYRRASGLPADGVIQVDPSGLAAILEAVGPVSVPELGTVDAGNVERLVLNEAYRLFPGVEERTDVLGDVAEAAFRRLVEGEYPSIRDLAEAISEAVDGRHIMVHSSTPSTQSAIRSFGADGSLPSADSLDSVHLTVQNLAGNKLDYYLDTALEIEGSRPGGEPGDWTATITLTNSAPVGETQPRYIFGPLNEEQTAGTYRGAVSLYLPTGSSLLSSSDGEFRLPPALQTEASRPLVSYWIDVPAGESRTVTLDLRLAPVPPGGPYELLLVPSARVRPTVARVDVDTDDGRAAAEVVLDRPWIVRAGSAPTPKPGIDG